MKNNRNLFITGTKTRQGKGAGKKCTEKTGQDRTGQDKGITTRTETTNV
jgi:hypothetical protein